MAHGVRACSFTLIAAVGFSPALLLGADREELFEPVPEIVDMFPAMEAGQIDVKLIPKDSTECRVLVENKTDKPLTVRLPSAFAGVPVLAQFGGGGGNLGGMGGMGGAGGGGRGGRGGGNQSFGGGMGGGMMGGMGGMGGGMGGMGGGMGMMNIPPEKVGKRKLATVCLEHGKKDPRPSVPYVIKPIEQVTDKPQVHELCRMLGNGVVSQRAAQVAAWHLNNNMSWNELAAKRIKRGPMFYRYFSPTELRGGINAVTVATRLSEQRAATEDVESPGESLSQK